MKDNCKHENRGYRIKEQETVVLKRFRFKQTFPGTITTYCADCGSKLKVVEIHE